MNYIFLILPYTKENFFIIDHLIVKSVLFPFKCRTCLFFENSSSYTGGSKRCNLCLEEKLSILKENSKYLLNKRSEIVLACHHKYRFQVNHLTKKGMHAI